MRKTRNITPLKKGICINLCLVALLAVVFIIGCGVGQYRMSPQQVFAVLTGGGDAYGRLALFEIRLPRLVLSVLVGLGMGVSGVIMQDLMHNDLASPGTLGVSAGSGLFVTIYVALIKQRGTDPFLMPILALAGGLLSAGIIFLLGIKKGQRIQPTRIIMTGVAMNSAYGAISMFFMMLLDNTKLEFLQRWQSGELWGTQWKFIAVFSAWLVIFLLLTYRKSLTLNVINMGYDVARGLGVDVGRQFIYMAVCAVALSSSAVAFGGNFFFLGLIGPHIARKMVGTDARVLFPASGIVAAIIVLMADMLVRGLAVLANIPTGIIISVISVPYFLYLLIRS